MYTNKFLQFFLLILFLICCFFTCVSYAVEKNNIFLVCERHKEVRWLRTFTAADGKCKSIYSKEGYSQVVSSATYFSSCEAVLLNVKKNIEDGGFKCRDQKLGSVIDVE